MDKLLMLPVFGLIALTIGVALWMLKLRFKAVKQDGVNPAYFKLNRGAKLPNYLVQVTQHYENLLETPILFYIAILFILTQQLNDMVYVILAWLFFASRLLHAYLHTINNRLKHRRNAFILTSIFLISIWCKLAVDVLSS